MEEQRMEVEKVQAKLENIQRPICRIKVVWTLYSFNNFG